ncbi:MAG: signal peptidase II [Bryobacteraceae bacterium]
MTNRWVPFGIAGLIFIADLLSKMVIRANISSLRTIHVIPHFLNLVHTENPGIAFSLFSDTGGKWRSVVLIGLSAAVIVFIAGTLLRGGASGNWMLQISLALVLGGAAGNLYDRIATGTVTDFVEVHAGDHYFPAFNVADSGITIGALLLLIDALAGSRSAKVNSDHVS